MATVLKRGDAYFIMVSGGYDSKGKQVRKTTTWKPDEGMTEKQIEKELERQKVLFEDKRAAGGKVGRKKRGILEMKIFRIRKKLCEKRGGVSPINAVMVYLLLVFFCIAYIIIHSVILIQGTRNAVQSAVIGVITSNYYTAYNGMREGNSGAYSLEGTGWADSINAGDVGAALDGLLGTNDNSGSHDKASGSGNEYSISDLQVTVKNAPVAASGNAVKLNAKAVFILKFKLSVIGINVPVNIPLSVSAGFSPKF